MRQHEILGREAAGMDLRIIEAGTYPEWRGEAERLIVAGEAILSDAETYGAHLDNHAHRQCPMWNRKYCGYSTPSGRTANTRPNERTREQQSERVEQPG